MTNETQQSTKVNWTEVIVFYVLACAISWPFFAWRDLYPESWHNFGFAYKNLTYMWGPGLSAIICFWVFRKTHVRTITFQGTSILKSLLVYFIPFAIWAVVIFIHPDETSVSLNDLVGLLPLGFAMILGEELGWRGFLQDSLRPIKEPKRWIILGLMWEMWHFTRGIMTGSPGQIVVRKLMLTAFVLVLAFVIGRLTERTKSLMVALAIHSWFNIMFEAPVFNTYLTLGLSLICWFFLLRKWGYRVPTDDNSRDA